MKITRYSTKITIYKAEKYVKIWERKTRGQVLARLRACLPETDKEIFRMSLVKTVLPFLTNQTA